MQYNGISRQEVQSPDPSPTETPMKIARIFAHRVELPLVEGSYKWSGGKSVSVFDSTIVGVETDCGRVGYGEVCPLGPFYLPAYAAGVRAGLLECKRTPPRPPFWRPGGGYWACFSCWRHLRLADSSTAVSALYRRSSAR